ncbi:hypothetical protein R5W24_006187 [Gemmata sp. JC717]|uniref:hypothetical protein n=1 Tax=Gemmata algarum TaxID=2975278 RepID=UPI0021BB8A74|nr:hypothetical protein [Gemmata algarum]MDY3557004.1 hypothetical protein [Gemmata algarum]
MAEPTQPPALPSTADTTPYVPIAWSAVAAAAVAGLFAVLLLVLGVSAFVNKKPLLIEELLILPVIGVVLSFAARRLIRNSEGTRTGESLADAAWWLSLVLGLAYFAYLFAISFAVRREAKTEVERWIGLIQKGDPEDAFFLTIPPGARQGVPKSDKLALRGRYGEELLAFKGTDLMRLAQRNGDQLRFTPGEVAEWSYKPGTIDCISNGEITCPEGKFPVVVGLKGVEGVTGADVGRQWMIVRPQSGGFIRQDKAERTTYGWMLLMLEANGGAFGKAFIDHVGFGPAGHPYLYRAFAEEGGDPKWLTVARDPFLQIAFAIPTAAAYPNANPGGFPDGFFTAPGGEKSTKLDRFLSGWNALGLFEAGRRLKDPGGNVSDKEPTLKVTDAAVELYIPVELPLPNVNKVETARGRLVVVTKDPALLEELKQRKAGAVAGEKPSLNPPPDLERWAAVRWRVARIESDLVPVTLGPAAGDARSGGPGGPGH